MRRTTSPAPSHRRLPLLVATAVLAAAWAQPAAAQISAYHDVSGSTHNSRFATLSQAGYRMVTLSIYGTAQTPLYAAVWVKRTGPAWVGFHGYSAASFQSFFNTWSANGYQPTILTATGSGSGERFAGVFEKSSVPSYTKHGMTEAQFAAEERSALDNGYRLATADVYGSSATPLFIATFRRNDEKRGWWATASTSTEYAEFFNGFTAAHCRPDLVATNDSGRYLARWTNDSIGTYTAYHGLSSAAYQTVFDANGRQGRYPVSLQGSGSGSGVRFAAVFAARDTPLQRQFTYSGTAVPALGGFDAYVQKLMVQNGVRSAALAVVKDCRLMLARGYTWAESGYPQTSPTSIFRIASMAKPLTAISVFQHLQRRGTAQISLGKKMLDFFPGSTPKDAQLQSVVIRHLLTHAGGWNRDTTFDPMFRDVIVAAYRQKALPVTKADVFTYMTESQYLQFTPGMSSVYSNFGFSVLGLILEKLNSGSSYEQVVQRDVFTPLGVTRARIGGTLTGQRVAGEVYYDPATPNVGKSVLTPSRPWVHKSYGTWNLPNMDAHGGWIMAAPDYAKVLAAFDLGAGNPLMNESWRNVMWSAPMGSFPAQLHGWVLATMASGGKVKKIYWHNGGLQGTGTVGARREDGLSVVLFLNRDVWLGGPHAVDLFGIADNVTSWPNHDLFPSVGIPGFKTYTKGSFVTYGLSCPGSNATPVHTAVGTPEIGNRIYLGVAAALPAKRVGMFVGSRTDSVDLSIVGAPGCRLYTNTLQTLILRTNSIGAIALPIDLPQDTSLVGAKIFTQFACEDPAANRFGLTFTHGVQTTVGGWR